MVLILSWRRSDDPLLTRCRSADPGGNADHGRGGGAAEGDGSVLRAGGREEEDNADIRPEQRYGAHPCLLKGFLLAFCRFTVLIVFCLLSFNPPLPSHVQPV